VQVGVGGGVSSQHGTILSSLVVHQCGGTLELALLSGGDQVGDVDTATGRDLTPSVNTTLSLTAQIESTQPLVLHNDIRSSGISNVVQAEGDVDRLVEGEVPGSDGVELQLLVD